ASDNPSTLDRTVTFKADDGVNGLQTVDTNVVHVSAVNDPPTASVPVAHYAATEQTTLGLKNASLQVADVDGNAGVETATLTVSEGTLPVTAGGSGASVSGSGTSVVTINGTVAQIDALLFSDATSTVNFIDPLDTPAAHVDLALSMNDNG